MRVRHLQTYLREQKFAKTGSLSACRGMRIGIDAIYFFRSLKTLSDPLSDVSGSLSPGFKTAIDDQLEQMDRLQLQPLFVFQGMQPRSHVLLSAQMMCFAMHDAWALYARGDVSSALSKFASSSFKEFPEEIIQLLVSHLKLKGREVVRAPYFAIAQLAYFVSEALVDAILGPPSILLFGVPRVMISVDLARGQFEWVELHEILKKWSLSADQFVDACLLAGTEHCLSFPFLSTANSFSFANAIECIKQGPIIKHISQFPNRDALSEYVDGYCVGKSLVVHSLVMTLNGDVSPLNKDSKLPSDYHRIVGIHLPRNLYYLMCEGLISIQLPFALALGEWVDEPNPNTDSMEYRDLLQDVREYHCRALGLVALKLDDYTFQNRLIKFPSLVAILKGLNHAPIKSSAMLLVPNAQPVRSWNFTLEQVQSEMSRQAKQKVDLPMILKWHLHSHKMLTQATVSNNYLTTSGMDATRYASAMVHFMLLDNLGFFTREGGATAFGRALATATPSLGQVGLLILEMLKFGIFTGDPFEAPLDTPYSPELLPPNGSNPDLKFLNLAARLSTLCPLDCVENLAWRGPVDFDVASFNALTRLLKRSINYLAEGCLSNVILPFISKMDVGIDLAAITIPLFYENCTFMGVLVKVILQQVPLYPNSQSPNEMLKDLSQKFPNVVDITGNLAKLVEFWGRVSTLLSNLNQLLPLGEAMDQFVGATMLLTTNLSKLGIDVSKLKLVRENSI